jgi:hypothetical protein
MARTKTEDIAARHKAAAIWPLVRLLILKPPGKITAMVIAASKPLTDERAKGVHCMDFISTPEVLHKVAAKTNNKTDFKRGLIDLCQQIPRPTSKKNAFKL